MADPQIDEIEEADELASEDAEGDSDAEWSEGDDLEDTDFEDEDFDVDDAETPIGDDDDDDADGGDDAGDDDEEDREALDELEAEELEMLTDDEESETLIVDEAAELRAIRRAELAMEGDGIGERAADEFLCQGCFLVLKRSQLADAAKTLCRDCAA